MTEIPGTLPLFGPDDEMGRVMAAHDWSESILGDPGTWPPLLQTLVRIVATSRFSMWMAWGTELSFFYNEAYARGTLGVKHPWALGRPAWEVWSEIWDDIGPRIEAVLTTGAATWDEDLLLFLERSGYREETYHTFSYSPISEADGRIVGMLCVVSEETQRVISERRMATLRDLASDLSAARGEPDVFAAAARRLGENQKDLPFTLTYMFEGDGSARLACSTGIEAGHPAAPGRLDPGSTTHLWPVYDVASSATVLVLDDTGSRFPDLPAGAWPESAHQAVLVPLVEGGQSAPVGVFVAGLNPFRAVDTDYQGFTELVAGSIASGVSSARAYESERRRAEALAELDRAKTEFFSNVSHEFRTPLTLIIAPADDALGDDLNPLAEVQRSRVEIIQRNARRLRRLVNDMLDFARIEGGRLQAETIPTDLARFTSDVAMSFAPAIERSGLAFQLELSPLAGTVHIDRDMWEKIVLNLLSNALKFTLEGSVTLGLADRADEVVMWVADTGVGIPAEHLDHLFERFYRAPRSAARSHEGTGIGLALVAELARLHGGKVSVTSREDVGSRFEVTIPYGSYAPPAGIQQRESSLQAYLDEAFQWVGSDIGAVAALTAPRSVVGSTARSTVLVADDNPDMRGYLQRLLEPFWRVEVAADGIEAMELVRVAAPDLVLTDVMMPGLDGFGLLAAMRSDPATATIPVVFLSARAGEEAAVEGLEAGADDYLVKPFSGLELLARVRSNLELANLRNREAAWRAALVDSLQDAVVVLDAGGQLIEANAAFEEILGFSRSGVPYSLPFPWMYDTATDAEAAAQTDDILGRVMSGERVNAVIPIRHRLGHRMHVALAANSVGEGEERRVVAAFHDVTSELAASERDAALARLGVRLAEASDVKEVREAGLTQLCRAFRARRAALIGRDDGGLVEQAAAGDGAAVPPDIGEALLARAATENPVIVAVAGEGASRLVRGMGATVDPRDEHTVVGLEFDPPRPVTAEERSLFSVLCGYFGQALRRAQLFDDSRTVATTMQRAILGPTSIPANIAVRYFPAIQPLEVGGDWYDVVELPGDRLAVVVGDCTGRGLEAATTMGQLRSACRALLLQAKGPAEAVAALDNFAERLPGAMCTTVFCGVVDESTQSLHYSSAGHLPALLVGSDGSAEILDRAQGVPLGYMADVLRPQAEVSLPPGSTLVLYTDGLVERRRESLDVGIDRLRAALVERREMEPEHLADQLLSTLVPEGGHDDDIAVLVYRRPGLEPASNRFAATLRAEPGELAGFRRRLRDWLTGNGVTPQIANDIMIASGEACANAIEHAYSFSAEQPIEVSATFSEGVVEMRIADRGGWKDPGAEGNRGRGLQIMAALTDDVTVERGGDGTVVRLTRRAQP